MMNDDVHNYSYVVQVFIGLYQNGREMIHNFCYSNLINDQYTMHMYCTVQVSSYEYSTEYTVLTQTVQYKVYHYFLLSSILFGGA